MLIFFLPLPLFLEFSSLSVIPRDTLYFLSLLSFLFSTFFPFLSFAPLVGRVRIEPTHMPVINKWYFQFSR